MLTILPFCDNDDATCVAISSIKSFELTASNLLEDGVPIVNHFFNIFVMVRNVSGSSESALINAILGDEDE